jgi:hypothetical protein
MTHTSGHRSRWGTRRQLTPSLALLRLLPSACRLSFDQSRRRKCGQITCE